MSEVFDEQALMDRVDGDYEFLEETISMLDEDGPYLLRQVQEAATANDAEALVKPAHALKGMLANFCAEAAETAACEVEIIAREQRLTEVGPAIETLQREIEQLRNKLHQFLVANKE